MSSTNVDLSPAPPLPRCAPAAGAIRENRGTQTLVNIDVPELEAAVAFYQNALGLTLSRILFEGTVAELSGASVTIMLLQKHSGSSAVACASLPRDYHRHWTPVHLDVAVTHIESATEQAVAARALLEGAIQDFKWGRQACLAGPFGRGFCLIAWRGGGYG